MDIQKRNELAKMYIGYAKLIQESLVRFIEHGDIQPLKEVKDELEFVVYEDVDLLGLYDMVTQLTVTLGGEKKAYKLPSFTQDRRRR